MIKKPKKREIKEYKTPHSYFEMGFNAGYKEYETYHKAVLEEGQLDKKAMYKFLLEDIGVDPDLELKCIDRANPGKCSYDSCLEHLAEKIASRFSKPEVLLPKKKIAVEPCPYCTKKYSYCRMDCAEYLDFKEDLTFNGCWGVLRKMNQKG